MTAATARLTEPKPVRTYVPKPPSQRAWTPQATDPGQRITWTRSVSYATTETRTGTIWSAGALPSSVWVQPDDAEHGAMALVTLRNMLEQSAYPVSWQRDTVKRCEHLRQARPVFAEQATRMVYEYGKGQVPRHGTVAYHCDPDCPEIKHDVRACWDWEPTTGYVIRTLLDASARGRSDWCRTCIYLTAAAELGELVNA